MSRGNGRMRIFLDDEDRRKFMYILSDVAEEFKIDCFAYCLMPNHYHAGIRPSLPNLSDAIRHLNGRYAQWWNWRHRRVGHVFQGRFKDQIVQREGYFTTLCRYIALNPVRGKLVKQPADWSWSSYAATAGLRDVPAFLAVEEVLRQFGDGDERMLQQRFADYVLNGDSNDEWTYERIRSKERVLGDGAFKKFIVSGGLTPPEADGLDTRTDVFGMAVI